MLGAPCDVGEAQLEVPQRAADRDVGQRKAFTVAPRLVAQLARHFGNPREYLAAFARSGVLALLAYQAPRFPHDGNLAGEGLVGDAINCSTGKYSGRAGISEAQL